MRYVMICVDSLWICWNSWNSISDYGSHVLFLDRNPCCCGGFGTGVVAGLELNEWWWSRGGLLWMLVHGLGIRQLYMLGIVFGRWEYTDVLCIVSILKHIWFSEDSQYEMATYRGELWDSERYAYRKRFLWNRHAGNLPLIQVFPDFLLWNILIILCFEWRWKKRHTQSISKLHKTQFHRVLQVQILRLGPTKD